MKKNLSSNLKFVNNQFNKKFNMAFKNFSSGIVKIKYTDLVEINKNKNFNAINNEIKNAYGHDGLGLMVIQDVPGHFEKKLKFLTLTKKLAHLKEEILNKVIKPEHNYSLGWSHGKEKFNGKPDYMKGSYYAKLDVYNELMNLTSHRTQSQNVWLDEDFPELKEQFMSFGNSIRDISFLLTDCVDNYVRSINPNYNINFKEIIKSSEHNMGRLLHYFPRGDNKMTDEDQWCGWHNDHGGITGLSSALYFNSKNEVVNDTIKLEKTGLWIQGRDGQYCKGAYGKNDVAFQIGESYQILSGGKLHATPHAVIITDEIPSDVHRSTFALFLGPGKKYNMNIPEGANLKDIKTDDIYTVPKIQNRYKRDGMSFGEFDKNTIDEFVSN